jgi:hypothetical protein
MQLINMDSVAGSCMARLGELCISGPDGRSCLDWLKAAIGVALGEAERKSIKEPVVAPEHLLGTLLNAVEYKLIDAFSENSRPDLKLEKEKALVTLADRLLRSPLYTQLVQRIAEDVGQG